MAESLTPNPPDGGAAPADKSPVRRLPGEANKYHETWSDTLRHADHTDVEDKAACFLGRSTVLCAAPCEDVRKHTMLVHVDKLNTNCLLGMAPAAAINDTAQLLGLLRPSVGLRHDGFLQHGEDLRYEYNCGEFTRGDLIKMEYDADTRTLSWSLHTSGTDFFPLAMVDSVPREWHFAVSGTSAGVTLLSKLPSLTEEEKLLEAQIKEARRLHQKRLAQVKGLAPAIKQMREQSADDFAAAHEGESADEAAATGFVLNAALLGGISGDDAGAHNALAAGGALAGAEATLDSISLSERHRMLLGHTREEVYAAIARRDREQQQAELTQAFESVAEGLVDRLAPHLARYGVGLRDKLPDGRHVVAAVLQEASQSEWASVEALTENPELLATQAAAVKSPTAQIGITFELEDAGGEIADSHRGRQKLAETKQRIANALDVSPLQVEQEVEVHKAHGKSTRKSIMNVKVADAAAGQAVLDGLLHAADDPKWKEVVGTMTAEPVVTSITSRRPDEVDAGTFHFVDADFLRSKTSPPIHALCYQQLAQQYPDILSTRAIAMDKVLLKAYKDEILIVSHRWEQAGNPDPDGSQDRELREYLRENTHFKLVWHDFWCLPQRQDGRERTESEQADFVRMLRSVNLVYLGATVLILLDDDYMVRFWTSIEAWLSMQECCPTGLTPDSGSGGAVARSQIRLLPGVTEDKRGMLQLLWASTSIEEASRRLADPKIQVTNKGDKQKMLERLKTLNDDIRNAWSSLQVDELLAKRPELRPMVDNKEAGPMVAHGGKLVDKEAVAAAEAAEREAAKKAKADGMKAVATEAAAKKKSAAQEGPVKQKGTEKDSAEKTAADKQAERAAALKEKAAKRAAMEKKAAENALRQAIKDVAAHDIKPSTRDQAIKKLHEAKPESLAPHAALLYQATVDLDGSVGISEAKGEDAARKALEKLEHAQPAVLAQAIVAKLEGSADPNVSKAAVQALERLEPEVLEPYISAIDFGKVLCGIETEPAALVTYAPALVAKLEDSSWAVRQAAVQRLGSLEQATLSQHEPTLAKLWDTDRKVRQAAVKGLGEGEPAALQKYAPALAIKFADDAADEVRAAAATALCKLELAVLQQHLPTLAKLCDPIPMKVVAAVEALGKLEPSALTQHAPALVAKLEDSVGGVRKAAVEVLGKLEPAFLTQHAPALVAKLEDRWDVRKAAVEVLGKLAPGALRQHAPALVAKLEDSDSDVRKAAVEVLGKLERSALLEYKPAFEKAMNDTHSDVRTVAKAILESIEKSSRS